MSHYLGFEWWQRKKRALQEDKKLRFSLENKVVRTNNILNRIRQRRIRAEMGCFLFYTMPWKRKQWHDVYPLTLMLPEKKSPTSEELLA